MTNKNDDYLKLIKTLYNDLTFKLAILRKYKPEIENDFIYEEYSRTAYRLFHYNEHILHKERILHINGVVVDKFNSIDEIIEFDHDFEIRKEDRREFINTFYVLNGLLIRTNEYKQYLNNIKSNFKD